MTFHFLSDALKIRLWALKVFVFDSGGTQTDVEKAKFMVGRGGKQCFSLPGLPAFLPFAILLPKIGRGIDAWAPSLDLPLGLVEKAEKGEDVLRHNSDIFISIHPIM